MYDQRNVVFIDHTEKEKKKAFDEPSSLKKARVISVTQQFRIARSGCIFECCASSKEDDVYRLRKVVFQELWRLKVLYKVDLTSLGGQNSCKCRDFQNQVHDLVLVLSILDVSNWNFDHLAKSFGVRNYEVKFCKQFWEDLFAVAVLRRRNEQAHCSIVTPTW
jgi:hypothetical protein